MVNFTLPFTTNLHITKFQFLRSNIPSSPGLCCFYLSAKTIRPGFARRLSSKLLKEGYLTEGLKLSFNKFYGRYGDLIQLFDVSLSRMLYAILTLDQLQWLPYLSDFWPIPWPWHQARPSPNYRWFPGSICNGCDMSEAFWTPGSVPFLGRADALIVETSFPELAVTFPDFSS